MLKSMQLKKSRCNAVGELPVQCMVAKILTSNCCSSESASLTFDPVGQVSQSFHVNAFTLY